VHEATDGYAGMYMRAGMNTDESQSMNVSASVIPTSAKGTTDFVTPEFIPVIFED